MYVPAVFLSWSNPTEDKLVCPRGRLLCPVHCRCGAFLACSKPVRTFIVTEKLKGREASGRRDVRTSLGPRTSHSTVSVLPYKQCRSGSTGSPTALQAAGCRDFNIARGSGRESWLRSCSYFDLPHHLLHACLSSAN